jgi:hypothetical protein
MNKEGIIYLLKEREFIKTNENIFKIGKSRQDGLKRIKQYPKGSDLLFITKSNDCDQDEKNLIKILSDRYKRRKDIGNEYFEDNNNEIENIVKQYFSNIKEDDKLSCKKDDNNNTISNYKCLYCTYDSKLFNDMTRHLTKVKLCKKNLECYNYTDEEVLKLSLLHHNTDKNILNKNNKYTVNKDQYFKLFNEIEKNRLRKCPLCYKLFETKCELKKHVIIECVNIDINYINNLNKIENVTINNIKSPISFDEDWDVSHLSHNDKILIVISVLKYKNTLISVLNNKNNHNVIIDKKSNSGLVYKNNNIEVMNLNEIYDNIIKKIKKILISFIEEIKNNNINDIDEYYINHSLKIVYLEYSNYKYYGNNHNNTNDNIIDIFNEVKDETLKNFNEITKNKILNKL